MFVGFVLIQAALSSYLPVLYGGGKADSQKLQPHLSKLDSSLGGAQFIVQVICFLPSLFNKEGIC